MRNELSKYVESGELRIALRRGNCPSHLVDEIIDELMKNFS